MTLRLYLDEDGMDGDLVRALQSRGADVATALEAGMLGRDDDEHLAFAAARGRVLFSHNIGDYHRLHTEWLAAGTPHAGIVLARQQRYSVGELARRLLRLSAARTPAQMRDQLEFLSAW